jgi:hypothetical protein
MVTLSETEQQHHSLAERRIADSLFVEKVNLELLSFDSMHKIWGIAEVKN